MCKVTHAKMIRAHKFFSKKGPWCDLNPRCKLSKATGLTTYSITQKQFMYKAYVNGFMYVFSAHVNFFSSKGNRPQPTTNQTITTKIPSRKPSCGKSWLVFGINCELISGISKVTSSRPKVCRVLHSLVQFVLFGGRYGVGHEFRHLLDQLHYSFSAVKINSGN